MLESKVGPQCDVFQFATSFRPSILSLVLYGKVDPGTLFHVQSLAVHDNT